MADNMFTPEQADVAKQLFELMNKAQPVLDLNTQRKIAEAKQAEAAAKALKDFGQALRDQIGTSIMQTGKAMMSSQQGFGKFGDSITGVTDLVGGFAQKLGFAGFVLGGFIKIIGEVAAASLKQNDDLMKSFRELSDVGAGASGGLEGLQKQLTQVGLAADEADKLAQVLKPVTHDLANFGGSVTEGRKRLVGLIGGIINHDSEMERSLSRLGYSTQDIREGAAAFVEQQVSLGRGQKMSDDELRKGTGDYMKTLKELQELTGMSRDEAEKAMQAQLADARMNMHLADMEANGQGRQAKNLQAYLVAYEKQFGKEAAGGLKQLILSNGAIVDELSAQAYQSTQGRALELSRQAAEGGVNAYAHSIKQTGELMFGQMKKFQNVSNMAADSTTSLTGANEAMVGALKARGMSEKDIAKLIEDEAKNNGNRVEQNVRAEQDQRAMRMLKEQALMAAGDGVIAMFTKLTHVGYEFGKGLASVIDFITKWTPGLTATHLRDTFRDTEDVKGDLEKKTAERDQALANSEIYKNLANGSLKLEDAIKNTQAKLDKEATIQRSYDPLFSGGPTRDQVIASEAETQKQQAILDQLKEWNSNQRLKAEYQGLAKVQLDKDTQNLQKINEGIHTLIDEQKKLTGSVDAIEVAPTRGAYANDITSGKTLAERNFNPGNIRYVGQQGAQIGDKGFAKFENDVEGFKALQKQLERYISGQYSGTKLNNIESILKTYAPSNENDTKAYIDSVVKQTGISKDTEIDPKDPRVMSAIMAAIAQVESGKKRYTPEQIQAMLGSTTDKTKTQSGTQVASNADLKNAPQKKLGGEVNGPASGYAAILHGNEFVLNEEDTKVFKDLFSQNVKTTDGLAGGSLSEIMSKYTVIPGQRGNINEQDITKFNDMISQFSLVTKLSTQASTDTSDKFNEALAKFNTITTQTLGANSKVINDTLDKFNDSVQNNIQKPKEDIKSTDDFAKFTSMFDASISKNNDTTVKLSESLVKFNSIADINIPKSAEDMNNMFAINKSGLQSIMDTMSDGVKNAVASLTKMVEEQKQQATQSKVTEVAPIEMPKQEIDTNALISTFNTMIDRMDTLIDISNKSKNIQDEHLSHART
jgi:hypothetical protein